MLLRETFPVGPLECNCTVLGCPDTKEAAVIDPGGDPERIEEVLRHYDLTVRWLLHTHAHIDHIGATRDVKEAAGGLIGLHPDDRPLYGAIQMQAALLGFQVREVLPVDRDLRHGDVIELGKKRLTVVHTPGHTPGSLCFRLGDGGGRDEELLFAGDTLFRRGIGRTDLWGGDFDAIQASIRERLYTLAPETVVVPGHGPSTTIGEERRANPFVTA